MEVNHLDNYYLRLPEPQQSVLLFIRKYFLEFSAQIAEHYKYGGPFFHYKGKQFAYLAYSKVKNKTYVGLIYGYRLNHPKLVSEGRKQIKVFYLDVDKDIDVKNLNAILKLALKTNYSEPHKIKF